MAELYYGMNRVTTNRAGKKFSKDMWKPIAYNAAQPLAMKQMRGTDQP